MTWQKSLVATIIAATFLSVLADQVLAQSLFSESYNRRQEAIALTIARVSAVVFIIGLGFGIGWAFTPQNRKFRQIAFAIIVVVMGLIVILNNGALGWSTASILAVGGFIFGILFWLPSSLSRFAQTPTTFGSSRWATPDDIKENDLYDDEGIYLGTHPNGEDADSIFYNGDRHLLTVAPTRSGKGTTQIIPNLLTYEGSMLVIDPKGENALITAKRRQEMGQEVHIVDPWGIADVEGVNSSTFNPLDWLDIMDDDITENAMILADALIVGENHADSFWNEEAKALLQGILLYVASDPEEDGNRNLSRVRDWLVASDDEQQKLFQKMAKSDHRIISSTGNRCLQKDKKLLSNVLASAQAQTHFLDSNKLSKNLNSSSLKFEDLKSKPMTIYLVLPADRLGTFGRWLRLLVQQAITVNARNIEITPKEPVLFILDEFTALGRLSMVEQAYGLMAGFGMQLWGIIQDLSQLERVYGDGWQSFIANAGMVNYFGSSDQKTAEYFSAMCGETTVWNLSSAVSTAFGTTSGQSGGTSETTTNSDTRAASQRKLIYPDELMRLSKGKQLVLIENLPPLMAKKVAWFDDDELKSMGVNLQVDKNAPAKAISADELLQDGIEHV